MARKLPRLQRVLDAPALFSIAYGEIASSIYFALGIIAFHALGFTPAVLLLTGALFLVVSLSYAEGTAAIRERWPPSTFPTTPLRRSSPTSTNHGTSSPAAPRSRPSLPSACSETGASSASPS
jgi:hypothetical protein